jgi:hypothetical protein
MVGSTENGARCKSMSMMCSEPTNRQTMRDEKGRQERCERRKRGEDKQLQ